MTVAHPHPPARHRIGWHADADVGGSDPWYWFVCDERWRMVATYRASDANPKERFVYHHAGTNGYGGSSSIDSTILRDADDTAGWVTSRTDLNGNGAYGDPPVTGDPGDQADIRGHDLANQIDQREVTGPAAIPNLYLVHDDAGNLRELPRSSTGKDQYTHDAWNRLVRHDVLTSSPSATTIIATQQYKGLHWRTFKTNGSAIVAESRALYYSAAWQLIEEHVHTNDLLAEENAETNRVVQEVWGLRYIDDPVLRTVKIPDGSSGEGEAPDQWVWESVNTWEYYHLTDVQFSTVAMIQANVGPFIVERVRYDAYGRASHHYGADVNFDGYVNSTDQSDINSNLATILDSGYNPDYDFFRNGVVASIDATATAYWNGRVPVGAGMISDSSIDHAAGPGPDNSFGYCGYVFNPQDQMYYVRARWYDPSLGRWLQRDPALYIGGTNLYGYVNGRPTTSQDAFGLYDESGHFYTTLLMALCANYSPMGALQLAYYSQLPDQDSMFDAIGTVKSIFDAGSQQVGEQFSWMSLVHRYLHSLHGGDAAQVESRRKCLAKLLAEGTLSPWERGFIIHALADSFAHTYVDEQGLRAYDYLTGHVLAGHEPDIIANNTDKYQEYLSSLETAWGCSGCASKVYDMVSNAWGGAAYTTDGDEAIRHMRRLAEYEWRKRTGKPLPYHPENSGNEQYRSVFGGPSKADVERFLKFVKSECDCFESQGK